MSDEQPTEPTVPFLPPSDVETVGPEERRPPRRGAVIAGVAAAVAAVLAGGAYAAYAVLDGGGPQPADVLPASTVAVVSVDLDPSAGQKIAAIKSIRRFPALKESLGLDADDDLREYVFDKVIEEGDCTGLDFDDDVKPWLGKRAAFAGVDLGGKTPVPAIVLQVSDAAEARKGFDAVVKCTDPEDFAFVVGEDYLVASDSAEHAQAILTKGKEEPLADDPAYQKWTGEAGDPGVLGFYVGKRAADYADDLLDELSGGFTQGITGENFSDAGEGEDPSDGFGDDAPGGSSDALGAADDLLQGFEGLGGTVRFAGGGMELSVAGGGIDQVRGLAEVGKHIGGLPGDTAAALGFGVSDDYAEEVVGQLESDGFVSEAEEQTGLSLPEDLQTLLGDSLVLALGGEVPDSLDSLDGPEDVPAGIVVHGDPEKIKAVITKVEEHLDWHLSDIPVVIDSAGDKLVLATSDDYASALLEDGSLGSTGNFDDAVPEADKASGVLYVDFDSGWRQLVAEMAGEEEGSAAAKEVEENTEPLRALGISSWENGGVTHLLFKVTTD
jgi:hypothetical protein